MFENSTAEAAVNMMMAISANYPGLYLFSFVAFALVGVFIIGVNFYRLVQLRVFMTLSPQEYNFGMACFSILAGTGMVVAAWLFATIGQSVLDHGYGSLFPPEQVNGGLTPVKMMGMFVEYTLRLLGVLIGFWGLANIAHANSPGGDKQQMRAGIVRVIVGPVIIYIRDFANLFGGMGDKLFG
ncbi:hypothetical protein [Marinobacterium stanieri]|uniref:Uncharacterized protein n=1 Tax=Marinobacterium stanieri TaxID=49186 RepID=A0A1N6XAS1_9GAMM|nr:hypothetical protein [Marinobacterium stanieri]SIQ99413.1 hypothetical protein SAMN05421647_11353 [Marinobacterium stanieri]